MGVKRLVSDRSPKLIVQGAREHNLKDVTVEFPLLHLVCVTGVSGSGKSTLMQDVLAPALLRHFGKPTESPGLLAKRTKRCSAPEWLADAVFVDQSPIGKTARSNPASYVGAFDEIRKLFAQAPLALQRGYTAGMFSFNAGDGRCPTCGGSGFEHVEMQFLSDVYLRCPDCDGRRYRPEVLDVKIERRLTGEVAHRIGTRAAFTSAGQASTGSARRGSGTGPAHPELVEGPEPVDHPELVEVPVAAPALASAGRIGTTPRPPAPPASPSRSRPRQATACRSPTCSS